MSNLVSCKVCHAEVSPIVYNDHLDWHEKLFKAMGESPGKHQATHEVQEERLNELEETVHFLQKISLTSDTEEGGALPEDDISGLGYETDKEWEVRMVDGCHEYCRIPHTHSRPLPDDTGGAR